MREESKRLLAGYATGSLSDAERKALFDAALEDQDVFDELAREQALKELIDLPGAKPRLIAALGPERRKSTGARAVWAMAAMIAIGIGAAGVKYLHDHRTEPAPVQIAALPTPVPAAVPAPVLPAAPPPRKTSKRVAPKTVAPPTESERDTKQQPQPSVSATSGFVPLQSPQAAGSLVAPRAMPSNARRIAAPISFDYTVHDQSLDLRFASAGFVSIRFEPGGETIPVGRVEAGSERTETIPDGTTSATVILSAAPDATGGVTVSHEETSGRVVDSAGRRIELHLTIR
jgi:hypothetical protein